MKMGSRPKEHLPWWDSKRHLPWWVCLLIVGGMVGSAYFAGSQDKKTNQSVRVDTSTKKSNVSYSILKSDTFLNVKRSIDVRLKEPISESNLRQIALELKAKDPKDYERTFICYFLPGMELDKGAWATTHFNPNLKIQVYGFTAEQDKALREKPNDASRNIIGCWLDTSLYIGGRITIFSKDEKYFFEKIYSDGGGSPKEFLVDFSNNRKILRKIGKSPAGEYYLIDKQGNLQLWDKEGVIWTAKKID